VQVDEDLGLRIKPAGRPHERLEVDAVAGSTETQVDAAMLLPFPEHPVGHTRVDQQPDTVTLEDACPVGRLDLVGGAGVQHDRVDTRHMQQMRQHQSRRPAADDDHLGSCPARRRCHVPPIR
jgi:hypothetical protein